MEASSVQVDATKTGVKVRHAQNPSKVGETTGEVRFRAGRDVATIRLANGELTYIPVDQLESLPSHESRIEAFASGRTGGPVELARQLLLEKISGDSTDVYYSMGSAKAKFHPHQFRPVLKYVESTGRRLLIADEAGAQCVYAGFRSIEANRRRAGQRDPDRIPENAFGETP